MTPFLAAPCMPVGKCLTLLTVVLALLAGFAS